MMSTDLRSYEKVVGSREIEELLNIANNLKGISVMHINSTPKGGGVVEILRSLVPLFKLVGISCQWQVIEGTEKFFQTTKTFHNLLQGLTLKDRQGISKDMLTEYRRINEENAKRIDFASDVVVIHDPQPAGLITAKAKNKWLWRCHIDLSSPDKKTWDFLYPYIARYDAAIFSMKDFVQSLPLPHYIIHPSIDPLSEKNRPVSLEQVKKILKKLGIPQDKPLLLQVSRFDYFKDPLGGIKAFRQVRKRVDCRLILAGGETEDDPESSEILSQVKKEVKEDTDIHILNLPPQSFLEINALQRSACIVIQKSLKEGFGLTVTEALWKARPVVAGNVGGIKLQIKDGENGFLVNSPEEAAEKIEWLLRNPSQAEKMGKAGKEVVREKFLITGHFKDYLKLIREVTR